MGIYRHGIILLFGLCACAPVMETRYEMLPPASVHGRECADTCLSESANCKKTCETGTRECEEREKQRAQSDYESYIDQQGREGRPLARSEGDFYRYYACQPQKCQENCQNTHNQCHKTCGGQVAPHSYCTGFCNWL